MSDLYILIGVVITAVIGFFGVRYASSGNINHSTASDLWKESQEIRKLLADEVKNMRDELRIAKECCEKHRAKVG